MKTNLHLRPKHLIFSLVIFAVSQLMLPGCSKAPAGASGDAIIIGTVQPLTGPYAAFGVKFYQAYNMAADEINAAGGVKGRPIQIVFEDSQDKLDLAKTAAQKLVENSKIVAIMGGRRSGAGLAIAQTAEREHIPYLVDHPSADVITKS